MDMGSIGGIFPPPLDSEHREEPNVNMVIDSLNNGVANSSSIDKNGLAQKTLQPPNPHQQLIKVTPPPPRFIQEKVPAITPSMPFTVLGSSKFY